MITPSTSATTPFFARLYLLGPLSFVISLLPLYVQHILQRYSVPFDVPQISSFYTLLLPLSFYLVQGARVQFLQRSNGQLPAAGVLESVVYISCSSISFQGPESSEVIGIEEVGGRLKG